MYITPKLYRLIEIHKKQKVKDLDVNLKEFHKLLDTLVYLHETLAELKVKMPTWKMYSDVLMTKFIMHSYSIHNLLSGIDIKSDYYKGDDYNKKVLDIPSVKIILRAQFEAFFMYHHIYVNPLDEEEKELRSNAWLYSSMLERQLFAATTSFAVEQKEKSRKEIERMKNCIQNLPAFIKLTSKQQKGLIEKGSDKLFKTWSNIMKDTGFDEKHAYYSYYYILSCYAHSEGISILQLKNARLGYSKGNVEANSDLFISKQLICLMIMSIKRLFNIINIKFNALPQDLQDTIEIYAEIGKSPMKI